MNHYTYELTYRDIKYIGVRSCECLPEEDTDYWGSSKYNPEDLRESGTKAVLNRFDTRLEAVQHEVDLHNLYDVGSNPDYWNRSKQTSTGFDVTGVKVSDETKAKVAAALSVAMTGLRHSEETKAKIAASQPDRSGNKNPMANPIWQRTCIHCSKTMDKGNHNRFHGDNCKSSPK